MSRNLPSSLSQWFFGSTGPDEIGQWPPVKRLLAFITILVLIYLACWAFFQLITPIYRSALAQTAEEYYSLLGRSFEFLVAGDRLAFRSYQRPAFEADLSISGLATNVPFLLALFLATPGMHWRNRGLRLVVGMTLLFFTQVLFLITKVEVTLIEAAHPLAASPLFWHGLDNFLEITGKAFFPVVIWLLFCLQYMLGQSDLATQTRPEEKVGRNDPCPCGSGRKYKRCCAGKA